MQLFNSHVHTSASPDCKELIENTCRAAVAAGLSGFAVTDHFSGSQYIRYNSYNILKTSHKNARRMAKEYEGKLNVLLGVELDEMLWHPEYIARVISSFDFDVILASVHRVKNAKDNNYLSRVNFSAFTKEELSEFVDCYFNDMLKTVKNCDFDVLCHLPLPVRYICGKYKRSLDILQHSEIIDEILKTLISRDKALELNTSEISNVGLMPNKEILMRYRQLGGTKVTIGTDSHFKENIAKGFDAALNALGDTGFDAYYYYKNRQPVEIRI